MKFKEIIVSFPQILYPIVITHTSPRKETLIEWSILELIKVVNEKKEYGRLSIDYLLKNVFSIDDANHIAKPTIIELYNLHQMIDMEEYIFDNTDLDTYEAKKLKLTETGLKLHNEGLIPGEEKKDNQYVIFDINSRDIEIVRNLFKNDKKGLSIHDEVKDLDDIAFPQSEIRKYYEDLIKVGKYLDKTEVIKNVELNESDDEELKNDTSQSNGELTWINKNIDLTFYEDMKLNIGSIRESAYQELILDSIVSQDISFYEKDIPEIKVEDVDEEYKKLFVVTQINKVLEEKVKENNSFIINADLLDIEELQDIKKMLNEGRNKVAIILSEKIEEIKIVNENKHILLFIPSNFQVMESNILFASNKDVIIIGKFKLKIETKSQDILLVGDSKSKSINLKGIIKELFLQFQSKDKLFLMILPAFELEDLFLSTLSKELDKIEVIKDKIDLLSEIIKQTDLYYPDNKIINFDFIRKKLIDEIAIGELNADKALKNLELLNSKLIKQNNNLSMLYIEKVLKSLKYYNLFNLRTILEKIKSFDIKLKTIKSLDITQELFNINIIREMFDECFNDGFQNRFEYSEFESPLKSFVKNINELERLLNKFKISLYENEDSEDIRKKILLENKNEIENKLKEYISRKQNIIKLLNTKFSEDEEPYFDDFLYSLDVNGKRFKKIEDCINAIGQSINFFFDVSILKYKNIYVVDTNALIERIDLIDKFLDNKNALIVPLKVIEELDKIKDTKDENDELSEIAKRSRIISRKIKELQENKYEWLIIGSANIDLLPDDLDKRKSDNIILSVVLKYIDNNPILITNDINLSNTALSKKIRTMDVKTFMKEDGSMKEKTKRNKGKKRR